MKNLNIQMKVTPKRDNLLKANGKIVHHDGVTFRVIANKTGGLILATAEQIVPKPQQPVLVNLMGRTVLGETLCDLVQQGLVS